MVVVALLSLAAYPSLLHAEPPLKKASLIPLWSPQAQFAGYYVAPFERGKLKGYMWEVVILELLKENEFLELLTVDDVRTRRQRNSFLEMRGRGAWHQIDCCCDYEQFIPFINPPELID